MNLSESDGNVRRKLAEMNIIPKDRKISNVVLENTNFKAENDQLKIENNKLREQLEQALERNNDNGSN